LELEISFIFFWISKNLLNWKFLIWLKGGKIQMFIFCPRYECSLKIFIWAARGNKASNGHKYLWSHKSDQTLFGVNFLYLLANLIDAGKTSIKKKINLRTV
jgi:hypothetical protein